MDFFAAIMFGLVAAIVVAVVALGIWYPGSGAAQVGWRTPGQHADEEAARDSEDLEQMLEAANARRRARGERELTVDGLLAEERRASRERHGGGGSGRSGGSGPSGG
jgi:hypothetical protein